MVSVGYLVIGVSMLVVAVAFYAWQLWRMHNDMQPFCCFGRFGSGQYDGNGPGAKLQQGNEQGGMMQNSMMQNSMMQPSAPEWSPPQPYAPLASDQTYMGPGMPQEMYATPMQQQGQSMGPPQPPSFAQGMPMGPPQQGMSPDMYANNMPPQQGMSPDMYANNMPPAQGPPPAQGLPPNNMSPYANAQGMPMGPGSFTPQQGYPQPQPPQARGPPPNNMPPYASAQGQNVGPWVPPPPSYPPPGWQG
jgi:hypothetical protein